MKVLVIGGSGLIGGDAALYLKSQGHDVTIMSRRPPTAPALAALPFLAGDYINDDLGDGRLQGFDAMVFAAAADIRNLAAAAESNPAVFADPAAFYAKANDEAVPKAFAAAKRAGIRRAVYIGSFYGQVAAHRVNECPYVASRVYTDLAVRALNDDQFAVMALDCPFVLGHIDGAPVPHVAALVEYARGNLGLPIFAPKGGSNHITSHSVAQAVLGALENGEGGKAYLVGDENYSWKAYLELWFDAVGNHQDLQILEDDHPMLPNVIMFAGAGATVSYEVDPADHAVLGNFDRQQIRDEVKRIVAAYS